MAPSSLRKLFKGKAKVEEATESPWKGLRQSLPQTEGTTESPPTALEPIDNTIPEQCVHGLKPVAEGENPVVDIVAVHGLNGHLDKTWTAANGKHWLRDFLPNDIPNARVFCWGYDANTHGKRVSCQYLYDHAKTLVSDLCLERELTETTQRPIIFVAHSLGGLIVKSALIHSDSARQGALKEHRSIRVSTYGIFFMGTPHQGGNGVLLGELLVNVASIFTPANDRLLKNLKEDSEWLQQQLGQYGPISSDFVTKFAFEEYKTPTMLGHSIIVVPRASAVVPGAADGEPIAIHANHTDMVRFASGQDSGYRTVSGHLKLMTRRAGGVVAARWEEEDRVDAARVNSEDDFSVVFSLADVSRTENFVARRQELAELHAVLCGEDSGDGRKTVVLHGLGGIGKTQLAVAYITQHNADYSAVFWLNIKDENSVKQSYARMATRIRQHCSSASQLNAITESSSLDEIIASVKRWLDQHTNTRWLMVFDNYDNPKLADPSDELKVVNISNLPAVDIERFLPDAYHGSVVITTRSSQVPIGRHIEICKLQDERDSLQILCDASRRKHALEDPGAIAVAKELDGLPLALATAGAYLYQVAISFQDYLLKYKKSWLELQQWTPKLSSYKDRQLHTTWQLSYDHIKEQNDLSARLLQLWAYFDNQDLWFELLREEIPDIPEWFARLTENEFSFHQAMRLLCNHGLAEADKPSENNGTESTGYSMHSCFHEWTIHVLNQEGSKEMAQLSLYCVSSHARNDDAEAYWMIQRRAAQHASRCWSSIKSGKFNEGTFVEFNALRSLHDLGELYRVLEKFEEAEHMFDWALHGFQSILGKDHVATLHVVASLASVHSSRGKYKESERMLKRALHGFEAVFGPDHKTTLSVVILLGYTYRNLGRLHEAEKLYQRALQGYQKASSPQDPQMFIVAADLGIVYYYQKRLSDAEEMYMMALSGLEKEAEHDRPAILNVVQHLSALYAFQNKFDQAEMMCRRALQGFETAYGPDHTSTIKSLANLARLYDFHGWYHLATPMYFRALQGWERALGPDHTWTLLTVENLGGIHVQQGKYAEAEKWHLRAYLGRQKASGPDHGSTRSSANNLFVTYLVLGKTEEAQKLLARHPTLPFRGGETIRFMERQAVIFELHPSEESTPANTLATKERTDALTK